MGIKMSQKIPRWYAMAMWSMRKQKFIDQLSCKIFFKTIKNGRLVAILDFISEKFVMEYPCVRPFILFNTYGLAIFQLRKYHKIT